MVKIIHSLWGREAQTYYSTPFSRSEASNARSSAAASTALAHSRTQMVSDLAYQVNVQAERNHFGEMLQATVSGAIA